MDMKRVGPAPLSRESAERLLDLLSSDDAFRARFKADAGAALVEVGYAPDDNALTAALCLQLKTSDQLASKTQIARDRAKLQKNLNSVVSFMLAVEFVEQ